MASDPEGGPFPEDLLGDFRVACGATGPLELEVVGPDGAGTEPAPRVFHSPFLRIGRDPSADLVLEDHRINRRHAYLQVIAGKVYCVDLNSRAGTEIVGQDGRSGWVDETTPIRIGSFEVRVRGGARVPTGLPSPLTESYFPESFLPAATLETTAPGAKPTARPMASVLALVGRSKLCRVKLAGDGSSRFFCGLLRTPKGVWLVDLLPGDGVHVNGQRSILARVEDGDEVRVGSTLLRIRRDATGGDAPPMEPPAPDRGAISLARPERTAAGELSASTASQGRHSPAIRSGSGSVEIATADLRAVQEFVGQMQRQMSDQFQQTMLMVSRMFSAMHGEHMAAVREELKEIHRLTDEIARLRPGAGSQPSPPADAPGTDMPAPDMAARPAPASPFPPITSPQNPTVSEPWPEGPQLEPPPFTPLPTPRRDPREIEALVAARLAEFERDRQGRWNKIVQLMTGR